MKTLITISIFSFLLTTGFTCSKNTPTAEDAPAQSGTPANQEQMAVPADAPPTVVDEAPATETK